MSFINYDTNLALICGRQRKSLTNTTRGDLFTVAPYRSFTDSSLQTLKDEGGWEWLDDYTGWTHLATLNNSPTAEYGNEYAGDHFLHGKFQDGKLRFTWQPNILTAENETDTLISKGLGRCNTKIHPLRLASFQESKDFFLDSQGKLKAYSYPLAVHTYTYTGYIKPSTSAIAINGCPRDLLVASRWNTLYFYVTHFVSDIYRTGFPTSNITSLYEVPLKRQPSNLRWDSIFSAGSAYTSLEPSISDTLLATYAGGFKRQEKGGFASDAFIRGLTGVIASESPPYYATKISTDYFINVNDSPFEIPDNFVYSAALPSSYSYEDGSLVKTGNSLDVLRLSTLGRAILAEVTGF